MILHYTIVHRRPTCSKSWHGACFAAKVKPARTSEALLWRLPSAPSIARSLSEPLGASRMLSDADVVRRRCCRTLLDAVGRILLTVGLSVGTVGLLSDSFPTIGLSDLSDCQTTLSDYCRNPLSDCQTGAQDDLSWDTDTEADCDDILSGCGAADPSRGASSPGHAIDVGRVAPSTAPVGWSSVGGNGYDGDAWSSGAPDGD